MNLRTTLLVVAAVGLFATALAPAAAADDPPVECTVYPHGEPNGIYCDVDEPTDAGSLAAKPPVYCTIDPAGDPVSIECEGEIFEPCPQSHCQPKPGE